MTGWSVPEAWVEQPAPALLPVPQAQVAREVREQEARWAEQAQGLREQAARWAKPVPTQGLFLPPRAPAGPQTER